MPSLVSSKMSNFCPALFGNKFKIVATISTVKEMTRTTAKSGILIGSMRSILDSNERMFYITIVTNMYFSY